MTQWTMKQAITCWIGSTCLTLVLSLGGYSFWQKRCQEKISDEKHRISAIIQTGPEKEALKTAYLAELLNLSVDSSLSLYAFDVKKGEEKLRISPLIAKAKIEKIYPNALFIDYEVRRPVAWLADYQNIAIDKEGYLFPVAPFFSPKELPEIYLGLPPFGAPGDPNERKGGEWLRPLKNRHLNLAFDVLQTLEGSPWREGLRIKRIDVSSAFSSSLGSREIVLFTEEEVSLQRDGKEIVCVFPKWLRLMPRDYAQQLNNFFTLRRTMVEDYKTQMALSSASGRFSPRTVDLRIPQLAFVQND